MYSFSILIACSHSLHFFLSFFFLFLSLLLFGEDERFNSHGSDGIKLILFSFKSIIGLKCCKISKRG